MNHQELVRRLGGNFGEKFFDLDVGEDDVGLTLKGFVITSFEPVSFLRRTDEGSSLYQKMLHRDPLALSEIDSRALRLELSGAR